MTQGELGYLALVLGSMALFMIVIAITDWRTRSLQGTDLG